MRGASPLVPPISNEQRNDQSIDDRADRRYEAPQARNLVRVRSGRIQRGEEHCALRDARERTTLVAPRMP